MPYRHLPDPAGHTTTPQLHRLGILRCRCCGGLNPTEATTCSSCGSWVAERLVRSTDETSPA